MTLNLLTLQFYLLQNKITNTNFSYVFNAEARIMSISFFFSQTNQLEYFYKKYNEEGKDSFKLQMIKQRRKTKIWNSLRKS